MGMTLADFHSAGSTPWCKDDWKIRVKIGAISCNSVLRKYAGILSGPVALWGFRMCKRLANPSTETDIWGISRKDESFSFGNDDRSSWVKIDVK